MIEQLNTLICIFQFFQFQRLQVPPTQNASFGCACSGNYELANWLITQTMLSSSCSVRGPNYKPYHHALLGSLVDHSHHFVPNTHKV